MSAYSIRRYLVSRPKPPFLLGGQFFREGGRGFLTSAESRLEISGDFHSLSEGDLITLHVVAVGESIEFDKAELNFSARNLRSSPQGKYSVEFASFVRTVRDFFVQRSLTEILTPTLVTCPGLEPHLEPFAVEVTRAREKVTAYLPTSPEISLKKALCRGYTDIFEIKNCFRRGEFSPHHENEFLMLEWYRAFADLDLILEDLRALLVLLGAPAVTVTTWAALFRSFLDFDLQVATGAADLRGLCSRLGVHHLQEDSFNDLFHRVVIDHIEPRMAAMGPLIVRDFPPSQAALARLTSAGWADRFELYWGGLEIANAFNEVCDPLEQERRWEQEQLERAHVGTSEVPDDPALIEALHGGMPPSGGIALGVERLFMASRGVDEIRDLRLFSSDDLFSLPKNSSV